MLSFVPGEVARWLPPPERAGDDVLVALARLIRALHEASAGWVPPPDAVWGGSPASTGRPRTERTEWGQGCWKSGVAQMRSRLYCLTLAMYCRAGAVSQRPANQRPTQPQTWPLAYWLPRCTVFSQVS